MPVWRTSAAALLAGWALFVGWCVWGFPPSMDLPAHAAQIQTLAELLRGNPEVASWYRATFPVGYGGTTWLLAPLALVSNGAVAARIGLWLGVALLPVAHASVAAALGKSRGSAVYGAPLAFGASYWFGFLPTLFALPWVLFAWAWTVRGAPTRRRGIAVAIAACSIAVLLFHVLAWLALVAGVAALALTVPVTDRRRTLAWVVLALAPSVVLAAPFMFGVFTRASDTTGGFPLTYDWASRFVWHLKLHGLLGRAQVWLAVGSAAVMLGAWWRRRDRIALALFVAMLGLYLALPKSMSNDVYYLYPRIAALVGLAALLLVDVRALPRWLNATLGLAAVLSLAITAHRHLWFARQIEGLAAVTATPPPPGVHGGLLLAGINLAPSRVGYLEHLPEWWTARHGGVGHHFFAGAAHQPVRFVEGRQLPMLLLPEREPSLAEFTALLVHGEGYEPAALRRDFVETQRSGGWRRFERR